MSLLHDLRFGGRALRNMRGAGVAAVLTLALGIGATTTMVSVVYAALLRPLPFVHTEQLLLLFGTQTAPGSPQARLRWSWPSFVQLRNTASSFERVASFTESLVAVSGGDGEPEQINAEVVSSAYFELLQVTPVMGRTFTPAEDTVAGNVVALSAHLWKTRFAADPAIVGRTIHVNGVPLSIVGVLPDGFAGISGKASLWISPAMAARLTYADYLTTPQTFIGAIARLDDGVSVAQANAELATRSAEAVPLDAMRIDPSLRQGALVLLAAAVCVLLIACVNVASLLLARARVRRREMAVRLAIGSGRWRLVQQLLAEGIVLAVVAGGLGLLMAIWGVAAFARLAPDAIPSGRTAYFAVSSFGRASVDVTVFVVALATAAGTTLLFALAPALASSRPDLVSALKDSDPRSGRHGRALSAMVVTEVALASLLLVTAGLLIENFTRIQSRRTGFSTGQIITFWVRPPVARYAIADGPAILTPLLSRIQALPGVEAAALSRCMPYTGCSRSVAFFPERPIDRTSAPAVGRHYVSADYFRALGIPLVSGRWLTDADRAGSQPVVLVNETGARRFWPGEPAVGKRLWFGTTSGPFSDAAHAVEIVGVVGDVKYEGVDRADDPARADFYTSYLQFSYTDSMFIVKARGPAAASLVPELRRAVAAVDPALPIYDVMTADERIGAAVARPRFTAALLTMFAGAALLLAAIGVYGVLSYSVSSRVREIGVRLALGADGWRVVRLVLGSGLKLTIAGAAIGLAGFIAGAQVVQSLVLETPVRDARILAGALVVIVVVAGLAAAIPALRAARVDPVDALRRT